MGRPRIKTRSRTSVKDPTHAGRVSNRSGPMATSRWPGSARITLTPPPRAGFRLCGGVRASGIKTRSRTIRAANFRETPAFAGFSVGTIRHGHPKIKTRSRTSVKDPPHAGRVLKRFGQVARSRGREVGGSPLPRHRGRDSSCVAVFEGAESKHDQEQFEQPISAKPLYLLVFPSDHPDVGRPKIKTRSRTSEKGPTHAGRISNQPGPVVPSRWPKCPRITLTPPPRAAFEGAESKHDQELFGRPNSAKPLYLLDFPSDHPDVDRPKIKTRSRTSATEPSLAFRASMRSEPIA